jgi:tRNA (guanosine-2'-O-)-methyltransferase
VADLIDQAIERYSPARVCEVLAPMLTPARIARIDAVLDARLASVITVVEDTFDPHNAAATIRTSEALGIHEVHVIEPNGRFSTAAGITRGSHRWLELHRSTDAAAAFAKLAARGFRVYATLPDAEHSIDDCPVDAPIAIAFGNEHAGLSAGAIAACAGAVRVPMFGFTESFNLSVTVGLAMSRITARRRAAIGRDGDLAAAKRAHLRARWFALKIRAAHKILDRACAS